MELPRTIGKVVSGIIAPSALPVGRFAVPPTR
jgi:hypothetical protein